MGDRQQTAARRNNSDTSPARPSDSSIKIKCMKKTLEWWK